MLNKLIIIIIFMSLNFGCHSMKFGWVLRHKEKMTKYEIENKYYNDHTECEYIKQQSGEYVLDFFGLNKQTDSNLYDSCMKGRGWRRECIENCN